MHFNWLAISKDICGTNNDKLPSANKRYKQNFSVAERIFFSLFFFLEIKLTLSLQSLENGLSPKFLPSDIPPLPHLMQVWLAGIGGRLLDRQSRVGDASGLGSCKLGVSLWPVALSLPGQHAHNSSYHLWDAWSSWWTLVSCQVPVLGWHGPLQPLKPWIPPSLPFLLFCIQVRAKYDF